MIDYDDICFDERLEDAEQCLESVPILRLATQAHRLARLGEIPGVTALALIIWPNPVDMQRFIEDPYEPPISEPVTQIEHTISDPDVGMPSNLRFYHTYLVALPGMCHAFIKLGYRRTDDVRCSRRASVGDYCRTHARINADLEKLADELGDMIAA